MSGRMRWVIGGMCVMAMLARCSTTPHQVSESPERGVEQIAWEAIAKGAVVVDVRTDAEYQQGHLPGAVNIPHDQIASRVAELPSDKGRAIVLYCRSGRRSGIAKQSLEKLGFTNAINAGGYDALMLAGPQ